MDESAVLTDYLAIRTAGRELTKTILDQLMADDLRTAARDLNMLSHNGAILFRNESETNVLMDYAIHEIFHDGLNAVGRMLRDKPPAEGSLDMRILSAMQNSRYSLLTVTEVKPGFGLVVKDALNNDEILLVDIGFSETGHVNAGMAARIYSPGGEWWMNSGASLPLSEGAIIRIDEEFKLFHACFRKEPTSHDRARMIVKACIAAGSSEFIRFADADENQQLAAGRR